MCGGDLVTVLLRIKHSSTVCFIAVKELIIINNHIIRAKIKHTHTHTHTHTYIYIYIYIYMRERGKNKLKSG